MSFIIICYQPKIFSDKNIYGPKHGCNRLVFVVNLFSFLRNLTSLLLFVTKYMMLRLYMSFVNCLHLLQHLVARGGIKQCTHI